MNSHGDGEGEECAAVQYFTDHVVIANNCGVPIEVQYCYIDQPDFEGGDRKSTCENEGARTTGVIEKGKSVKAMMNVRRVYTGKRDLETLLWTNICSMANRKATCGMPYYPYTEKNRLGKLFTKAETEKLEKKPAPVAEIAKASSGAVSSKKTTIYNHYVGISTDGLIYGELAKSKSEAKALMEKSSGRTMGDVLECNIGWQADWTLEIIDGGGNTRYVGAACNARSKDEAIAAALRACKKRGSNCLQSNNEFSSRVMVSVFEIDEGLLNGEQREMTWGTYCHVLDGRPGGDCSLRSELMNNGVYFSE